MKQLTVYNNPEFGDVRIVGNDGEPLFVGKDVAIVLGYSNPQKALRDHVPDKYKRTERIVHPLGGEQDTILITEAGLYKLVMRSKLPNAEKFSDWVCEDVIPSIRKHGVYATPEFLSKVIADPTWAIGVLTELKRQQDENKLIKAQLAEAKPKADYCAKVLESKEHLTSELIAKEYGETAEWLHEKLRRLDKIYKRGKHWYMKAPYAKAGYRDSETVTLERGLTVVNHFWTQKGRNFIYNTLKKSGIVPVAERESMMAELL